MKRTRRCSKLKVHTKLAFIKCFSPEGVWLCSQIFTFYNVKASLMILCFMSNS